VFRPLRAYRGLRSLPRDLFAALRTILRAVEDLSVKLHDLDRKMDWHLEIKHEEFQKDVALTLLQLHRLVKGLEGSVLSLRNAKSDISEEFVSRLRVLEEAMYGLVSTNSDLSKFLRRQARIFPSFDWSVETCIRVRSILKILTPYGVSGVDKIRVGRDFDGGYVMLNSFDGITHALSLGIGNDTSWDIDIANRGIRVLQYDPSISVRATEHPLVSFEPLRVSRMNYTGAISLVDILQTRVPEQREGDTLLLKMDIEGGEWDVCVGLSDEILQHFRQIVCEFHRLDRLGEQEFGDRARIVFETLTRHHFVCHVHGNNCGNFANVANIPVPESLEVTFASRAHFLLQDVPQTYPTALDRPNERGRADLYLGQFRFD
jgi:hypothetical protein